MTVLLSQAVAWVESKNTPTVVRFEPSVYRRLLERVQKEAEVRSWFSTARWMHRWPKWVTDETVAVWLAQSWGLYQIMGYNIYAYGLWTGALWEFLQDVQAQTRAFERFIANGGFLNEPVNDWDEQRFRHFAVFYNGPANYETYALKLIEAVHILEKEKKSR